jgi:WD40 repeat protein
MVGSVLVVTFMLALPVWALAQTAIPPMHSFGAEIAVFWSIDWVDDTLYIGTERSIFRFRPAHDTTPQHWRELPDDVELSYVTQDGRFLIWQHYIDSQSFIIARETLATRQLTQIEVENGEAIPYTGYSRDGRFAAVLMPDWVTRVIELHVYDLDNGEPLWTANINPNLGFLSAVVFSPDNHYVAVYGETSTIPIWDIETGTIIASLEAPTDDDILNDPGFSPDERYMYVTGLEHLFVYERMGETWEHSVSYPLNEFYNQLGLNGNGDVLIGAVYPTGAIHSWVVDGEELVRDIALSAPESSWVLRAAISDDGLWVATIDETAVLRVWKRG